MKLLRTVFWASVLVAISPWLAGFAGIQLIGPLHEPSQELAQYIEDNPGAYVSYDYEREIATTFDGVEYEIAVNQANCIKGAIRVFAVLLAFLCMFVAGVSNYQGGSIPHQPYDHRYSLEWNRRNAT